MTHTFRNPAAVKDMASGILFCLMIIVVMHMIPLLGIFAWVVLPLPVLFFRLKVGRSGSGLIMLISLVVLIVMTNNIAFNVLYFGSLMATGYFLGEFIEKHLAVEKIVIYTGLCVAGLLMLVLLLYAFSQGTDIVGLFHDYLQRYQMISERLFSDSAKIYPQMDLNPDEIKQAGTLLAMILPGILVNSYLTMVWINILLIKRFLKNRGITVQSIENLRLWKAPFALVFGVIVCSMILFFVSGPIRIIAINCLIVLMFVYFFQGIAIVSYFFQKKSAPIALRLFVYAMIAVQPLFLTLVIGFGLFDTWANFRKIDITV